MGTSPPQEGRFGRDGSCQGWEQGLLCVPLSSGGPPVPVLLLPRHFLLSWVQPGGQPRTLRHWDLTRTVLAVVELYPCILTTPPHFFQSVSSSRVGLALTCAMRMA